MKQFLSSKTILVGFILVMCGVLFPLLMVVRILEASFWLSFLSYGASVACMSLGLIGAFEYVAPRRE